MKKIKILAQETLLPFHLFVFPQFFLACPVVRVFSIFRGTYTFLQSNSLAEKLNTSRRIFYTINIIINMKIAKNAFFSTVMGFGNCIMQTKKIF